MKIHSLMRHNGGKCHYCGVICNLIPGHDRQATREHIMPKSLGGPGKSKNFTLACRKCNNRRGNTLFWCRCDRCSKVINSYLFEVGGADRAFAAIVRYNKPKIRRRGNGWHVLIGGSTYLFDSWQEAVDSWSTLEPRRVLTDSP